MKKVLKPDYILHGFSVWHLLFRQVLRKPGIQLLRNRLIQLSGVPMIPFACVYSIFIFSIIWKGVSRELQALQVNAFGSCAILYFFGRNRAYRCKLQSTSRSNICCFARCIHRLGGRRRHAVGAGVTDSYKNRYCPFNQLKRRRTGLFTDDSCGGGYAASRKTGTLGLVSRFLLRQFLFVHITGMAILSTGVWKSGLFIRNTYNRGI